MGSLSNHNQDFPRTKQNVLMGKIILQTFIFQLKKNMYIILMLEVNQSSFLIIKRREKWSLLKRVQRTP